MFLRYAQDRSMARPHNPNSQWRVHLQNGTKLEGRLSDYMMDTQGHTLMIQIEQEEVITENNHFLHTTLITKDIPWTSIAYIEEIF